MQLEMIPCPKCKNDFPKKRKELGYHVCVNCSTAKPVVGITTIEGTGDHTWNDIIIMDQDRFRSIAAKEAELSGKKYELEVLDFDIEDEAEASQSIDLNTYDFEAEDQEQFDPEKKIEKIRGIDY